MVRYARFKKTFVEATSFQDYMKEAPSSGPKAPSRNRDRKKVCFACRKRGHSVSECTEATNNAGAGKKTPRCYRCGSDSHNLFKCDKAKTLDPNTNEEILPFAQCFICKESGHMASKCPSSTTGIYPSGGCCHICKSVHHLVINCPQKSTTDAVEGNNKNNTGKKRRPAKVVKF